MSRLTFIFEKNIISVVYVTKIRDVAFFARFQDSNIE